MVRAGKDRFCQGLYIAPAGDVSDQGKSVVNKKDWDHPPQKPLLPFLEKLNRELPLKWDRATKKFVRNDDWLLWDLRKHQAGASVVDAKQPKPPKRASRSSGTPAEKG